MGLLQLKFLQKVLIIIGPLLATVSINNRHKILIKWILLPLTDSMPAPAMRLELAINS
jgi:hypothetical protein